ncbi:L-aspartate oxidase [Parelusimicrobium proximum]|uniref:L-aspartate oxidase n=1 Tax=Parelusimicrobium proximum TaxID=3228953 RepID=UPI003D1693D8
MKTLNTDCLVIGSGLAGSVYAYTAAQKGLKVILVTERDINTTNSDLAQGGVVWTNNKDIASLIKDVENAGAGLCNETAVKEIALKGSKVVENLFAKKLKTPFDKDNKGRYKLTLEGAHSHPRILYAKDTTGHAMLSAIHSQIKKEKNIKILTNHTAVELLTLSHSSRNTLDRYNPITCFGAYILDNDKKEVCAVTAKKTVLATGGVGQIFRHTTNSINSYGQGIAMAYRVGARVMNMEFVQFHPTVFAKGKSFLISEAVRGEGAVLVNSKGERFMAKYDARKDLAPRDIVARSIELERLKTGADSVFMDLSAIKPEHIKERFPNIYKNCLAQGVDITKEMIPVVPAAHYFCGGIYTSPEGRTNINNLNAVGECACTGFHGANRLASTSLLEALAMGAMAAEADSAEIKKLKFYIPKPKEWISPGCEPDANLIKQDLATLKSTMWNYVGLMRSKIHLRRAEKILRHLQNEIDIFYKGYKVTPELINLRNGVKTGILVVYAALRNDTSLGCHFISK